MSTMAVLALLWLGAAAISSGLAYLACLGSGLPGAFFAAPFAPGVFACATSGTELRRESTSPKDPHMIIVRPSEHSLSFDGNEEMTKLEVNCLEVENAYRRLDKHYEAVLSAEAELRLLRATGVIDLLDHMRKIDSASLQLAWHALAVVQAADCATAAVGSLGLWVNRLLDASHEDKLALLHKVNAIVCQQLIDRTSLLIELSRRRVVELLDDQIDIAIDTLAIRTFRARSACDHVWSWLSRELEIQPQ